MFFAVRGAEDFCFGRSRDFSTVGIRALDPATLRYELRQPAPYFLTLVAHWSWYPVRPATILKFGPIDRAGTLWTRPGNFVGNGAFTLVSWRQAEGAVVARNPSYWDAGRVRLAEIHFHFIDSTEAEERAFRSGQLQITNSVPRGKIASYRMPGATPLHTVPLYETDLVYLNLKRPPLDQTPIRQALSLAIDRAALSASVLRDGSEPARSLLPDDAQGYCYRGEIRLPFDPAKARRQLAAAGFPEGRGFPPVELSYPIGGSGEGGAVCEALQQMWRKNLGIEVSIAGQERRVFVDNLHAHRYTLALSGWIGDYLDPMSFLDVFIAASGHNDPGYRNPQYDQLISSAAGTYDQATRFALFQEGETTFLRDLPALPLHHRPNLHLLDPKVRGFESNLMDMHPYQGIWLENK